MIHDNMIKAYRAGKVEDIRTYDFKFNEWLWRTIARSFPTEAIERPIDVGVTRDAGFWDVYDHRDITFVGHHMGDSRRTRYNVIRTPIHRVVDIEPSDYVFCIDQINNLSKEDQLINTLRNLVTYSKKYIILTCWAYDIKIPEEVRTRKRHFWRIDNYVWMLESMGFKRIVRCANPDAINMLYIFKKL